MSASRQRKNFDLDDMIYHCVTRKEHGILVYEMPMDCIQIDTIRSIKEKKNIISFEDGLNEYSFNITKSTLYKRFSTGDALLDFQVGILENPFDALESLLKKSDSEIIFAPLKNKSIYSYHCIPPKREKGCSRKSGLNQWNASGRARASDEVYIPIPAWIHKAFPEFFPSREVPFSLLLPNGSDMSVKVCQDNSKALMSNPNIALEIGFCEMFST